MKMWKRLATMILAAAMIASLAGCGGKTNQEQQNNNNPGSQGAQNVQPGEASGPVQGGGFVYTADSGVSGWFQPVMSGGSSGNFIWPAMERLARYNQVTEEVKLELAEKMDVDPEAHTLTIKLREGVHFTDGSEMNADNLIWELQMYLDHGRASTLNNPTNIEKVDEYTVKVSFDSYDYTIMKSYCNIFMYSKKAYEEHGEDWYQTNLVGTGPYILDSFETDARVHYVRNDNYWREGNYLDEITIEIIKDETTRLSAFLNNETDVISTTTEHVIDQVKAAGFQEMVDVNGNLINVIVNNKAAGDPFNDLRVRQAVLLYGLDSAGITRAGYGKYAQAWDEMAGADFVNYNPNQQKAEYNVEKAKALLAEAGYPNGFSTQIHYMGYDSVAATAVQASLIELGIQAEMVPAEAIADPRKAGEPGLYVMRQTMNTGNDTTSYLAYGVGPGSYWEPVVDYSDTYREISAKIMETPDRNARVEMGKQLNEMASVSECFTRGISLVPRFIFVNPAIQNYPEALAFTNTPDPSCLWYQK